MKIMGITALFSGILLMTVFGAPFSTSCPRSITCPCGTSNQTYTHCLDDELDKTFTCETWAQCQTCEANTTHCITCPPKLVGPTCTDVTKKLIGRHRQFSTGSCPNLKSPNFGSFECVHRGKHRSCRGVCLPGYRFLNEKNTTSITLNCNGRFWTPRRSFPPCISEGYCGLLMKEKGVYNCTTSFDGTVCDITCDSKEKGRYRCYPGSDWRPQLPSCAVPKVVHKVGRSISCLCQNGGTCDDHGSCACLPGTTGLFCEVESQITGRGCKLQIIGSGAYNCTIIANGTLCDIKCNNVAQGRYCCTSGKNWKPQLPYCTVAKDTRNIRQSSCPCENGGRCDREGNCICPSGYSGSRCENSPTANCLDPGALQSGYRRLITGTASNIPRNYKLGESFQYFCNQGYQLRGINILTCMPSGEWSSNLPSCERTSTASAKYCSTPDWIYYGFYRTSDGKRSFAQRYTIGQSMKYHCQSGYELVGKSEVICLPSGLWSGKPSCRKFGKTSTPTRFHDPVCGDPGSIKSGYRRLVNSIPTRLSRFYIAGQSFQYFCNQGYELLGSNVLTCLVSGKWSSNTPKCQSTSIVDSDSCGYPGQKPYSKLVTPIRRGQIFYPRTRLTYACNEGYDTRDPLIIYCLSSFQWSSSALTCIRTVPTRRKTRPFCMFPEVDATGMIIEPFIDMNDRKQTFPPGTEIKFECEDGFELEGNIWIIYCKLNGEWTSEPPSCKQDNTFQAPPTNICYHPGVDENIIIEDDNDVWSIEQRRVYRPGAELRYRCVNGFERVGPRSLICTLDGVWSSDPPTCQMMSTATASQPVEIRIMCPNPVVDPNVDVEYSPPIDPRQRQQRFEAGRLVRFTCKNGYDLNGNSSIVCLKNGQWTSDAPTCRRSSRSMELCTDPGSLQNGGVMVFYNNPDFSSLPPPERNNAYEYPVGTRLNYDCVRGYRLKGEKNLYCREAGRWSGNMPECTEDCGISPLRPGGKISFGTNTTAGQFPWIVFLNMNETGQTCGGVLLDRRTVLSAAHCFQDTQFSTLYFGKYNRSMRNDDEHVVARTSSEIIMHPDYNRGTPFDNDIAIIKLSSDVPYSDRIHPICMPSLESTAVNVIPGQEGYVLVETILVLVELFTSTNIIESSEIIMHPDYNRGTPFDNDIAIIKLSSDVPYSDRIHPICMPSLESTAVNVIPGQEGYVSGWGLNERRVRSPRLMLGNLPVQAPDTCISAYQGRNQTLTITQGMFCAGYPDQRINACEGDSGSPMVFYNNVTERYVVEGLVSHGTAERCDRPAMYTVFTKVSNYLQWLSENWRGENR